MQQRLEGYSISPNTFFSFITALFVLPTVWLRDLRYLSYVSGSQSSNLTYNANCRSLHYSGFMNGTGPVICYKSIQNQIKPNAMPPRLSFWGMRLSFTFWRFLHYNCFVVPGLEVQLVTSNLHVPILTWGVVECSWRMHRINCSGHFGLLGGRGGWCGFPWKWSSYQLGWCSCVYWPLWLLLFWTCGFPKHLFLTANQEWLYQSSSCKVRIFIVMASNIYFLHCLMHWEHKNVFICDIDYTRKYLFASKGTQVLFLNLNLQK